MWLSVGNAKRNIRVSELMSTFEMSLSSTVLPAPCKATMAFDGYSLTGREEAGSFESFRASNFDFGAEHDGQTKSSD